MRLSASTLMAAEMRAFAAEAHADNEWIDWVRTAVSNGVRCDVSLSEVPKIHELAPGYLIYPEVK